MYGRETLNSTFCPYLSGLVRMVRVGRVGEVRLRSTLVWAWMRYRVIVYLLVWVGRNGMVIGKWRWGMAPTIAFIFLGVLWFAIIEALIEMTKNVFFLVLFMLLKNLLDLVIKNYSPINTQNLTLTARNLWALGLEEGEALFGWCLLETELALNSTLDAEDVVGSSAEEGFDQVSGPLLGLFGLVGLFGLEFLPLFFLLFFEVLG